MAILVINSGSSSVKFALFDFDSETCLASGIIERLGSDQASGELKVPGEISQPIDVAKGATATDAMHAIVAALRQAPTVQDVEVSALGHRVVHGGERFARPELVTNDVISGIRELCSLAPLHNAPNADGIEAARSVFPDAPNVAVFDTAFYHTVQPKVYRYAVPENLYTDHAVRRYGFHGTSHQFVATEAVKHLSLDRNNHRLLSAHLGNGCSATAIVNGNAVDTSMGITPLEGLVMGTRSGNVDPNLHSYLVDRTGMSLQEVTDLLNKKSGLLGLSGTSNDMRTLTELHNNGNTRATLAIDVFCFRLARELAGLMVSLEGTPNALIFTGGIGENSRITREKTIAHLAAFGFGIDPESNSSNGQYHAGLISPKGSSPAVIVIPTNEELAIARATKSVLS